MVRLLYLCEGESIISIIKSGGENERKSSDM